MKKRLLYAILPLLVFLSLCLCGCDGVEQMGTLSEFSHPYAGEYKCETLTLGGKDCLDKFEYITLTLKHGGDFIFRYRTVVGVKGGYEGEYSVSPEEDEITFSAKHGARIVSRTFPLERGAIQVNLQFGSKLLHAEFRFPS